MTTEDFIRECCIALQLEPGSLDKESSPGSVESWDSMGWLSLVAMVDDKLGLTLEITDLRNIKKIGDFVELLSGKGLLQ